MRVGVLKEIKDNENRVALTPTGAKQLTETGHEVLVEKNAGIGSGISNEEYVNAGAKIVDTSKEVADACDLVLKIKEPLPVEFGLFHENQMLFTYFHFASSKELTLSMMKSKTICIAYETVEKDGKFPLLAPMSEVAGKMAPLVGAYFLSKPQGGKGVLVSEVNSVNSARVTIIGGGVVGQSAATVATGIGADVSILEVNEEKKNLLEKKFPNAHVYSSTPEIVKNLIKDTDILIGAVYVSGARAPKVVSRESVGEMQRGSVIVDVAIDQGGCIETSKPTTHSNPTYVVNGVTHYCVANMPGAFPRTSTFALTNATLPYVLELANKGKELFLANGHEIVSGLNVVDGKVTNKGVAEAHNLKYHDPLKVLNQMNSTNF